LNLLGISGSILSPLGDRVSKKGSSGQAVISQPLRVEIIFGLFLFFADFQPFTLKGKKKIDSAISFCQFEGVETVRRQTNGTTRCNPF
jgi:hypothetical protein